MMWRAWCALWACAGVLQAASAGDVCRWKDAGGQTHFGDCVMAPAGEGRMAMKEPKPAAPAPLTGPASLRSPSSRLDSPHGSDLVPAAPLASRPVDRSRVHPGCLDLVRQISRVPPGVAWQDLARTFNEQCPGIAYECKRYRSQPEKDRCQWVERTGDSILQTQRFE